MKPPREPTTREERRQHRLARLVLAVQEAAAAWAEAEYQAGLADGRMGTGGDKRRTLAEAKFRDVAVRLSVAVQPPDSGSGKKSPQRRLPLK